MSDVDEILKPSVFAILDQHLIIIQVSIYEGYINLRDKKQIEHILQDNIIFLQFSDQQNQLMFEQFGADEIQDENILNFVIKVLNKQFEVLVKNQIGDNQYNIQVQQKELHKLIQFCDKELDDIQV